MCSFDLKMSLRKLGSMIRFQSYENISFMGRMHTPHPLCPKDYRYYHTFQENTVNVYLHVNLTLRKVKTENKYNCHSLIHSPYQLPCVNFSKLHHPAFSYNNFKCSFCKVVNRTRQTSPSLHLNDFKTKSKSK